MSTADVISRTMKVVGKNLKGKDETPVLSLKGDGKNKCDIQLDDEATLESYENGDLLTVKVVREQQTLG